MNRLITRGMGTTRGAAGRAGLITQGYGGFFAQVVEAVTAAGRRIVVGGRSAAKKLAERLDRMAVAMKLIRVNGDPAPQGHSGVSNVDATNERPIRVKVTESFTSRTRAAWEDIKITVKRVK